MSSYSPRVLCLTFAGCDSYNWRVPFLGDKKCKAKPFLHFNIFVLRFGIMRNWEKNDIFAQFRCKHVNYDWPSVITKCPSLCFTLIHIFKSDLFRKSTHTRPYSLQQVFPLPEYHKSQKPKSQFSNPKSGFGLEEVTRLN